MEAEKASKTLPKALATFPAPLRERIALGLARTTEYQDAAYGQPVPGAPADACWPPSSRPTRLAPAATPPRTRWCAGWRCGWPLTTSCAWPTSRAAPAAGPRAGEVKATDGDLLKVYDHFKPGVPEFAALLPPRWAECGCSAWDRARVAQGLLPWALPLKVGTHGVCSACSALRAAGRAERPAPARQPLRHWNSTDRALAGRRRTRHCANTGRWATNWRCAAG
jgi:indolepyruvate ferredoxin oxidoreductase beta subunit